MSGKRTLISFQTLEELWFGDTKAGWGDRRKNLLRHHLSRYTVIWPNPEMVEISAHLRSEMQRQGRVLHTADAWIATTALLLRCPLATYDRDFEDISDLVLIKAVP